jgi:TonB family protein
MTFFSDTQETVSVFGGYIEEFQHVLRENQVNFGTPSDFLPFARSLNRETPLREDLAVLVQSVMEREKNISLRKILSIIVIASGGPDLTSSGNDISQPVNLLSDFLISVGGCSTTSPQHLDSPCSELIDRETQQTDSLTQSSDETHSEQPDETGNTIQLEAIDRNPTQKPLPDSSRVEDPYAESLTRLELNSLQVKHYLDSIDQRISRMEPRLESLPAFAIPAASSQPKEAHDGKFSAAIASENLPPQLPDEPLPLEIPPAQANIPPQVLQHIETTPQQPPPARRLRFPTAAGLAAAMLLLILYWIFGHASSYTEIHPANPAFADNINTAPPPHAPNTAEATSAPPESVPPPQQQSAASVIEEASTPSSATKPSATVAGATGSTPSSATAPSTHLYSISSSRPGSDRRISVSSGVMAANVISAPEPTYPKIASLTHMQGDVVMQAIISKDGTIENLHVLKGHRLLRGAATSAVRTWRYRPYLVNGRPVEVATIVKVGFTLQH